MGSQQTVAPWLAGSLALGIWAAYALRPSTAAALALLLPALLLLFTALRTGRSCPPQAYLGLACLSFFAFGLYRMAGDLPENQPRHYAHAAPGKHTYLIGLAEALRPTAYSSRWMGEVLSQNGKPAQGRVLVSLPDSLSDPAWMPGDQVLLLGEVQKNKAAPNPHQFDYGAYLNSLGVYGSLRLEPGRFRLRPMPAPNWQAAIARLRQRLQGVLSGVGFGQAENGLLHALLLGSRNAMEPDQLASYQRAGAAHLLAVSGLHIGLFSGLVSWLLWPLRRFRYGRPLQATLVLLALWSYVVLAGAGPSAVRAAVLFSLLTYAVLSQRPGQSLHFWALAILFLLGVLQPLWLIQAGFQLSFAAVWAILVFYPPLYRWWPFKNRVGAYLGQLCCLGTAAQLGVAPLSLFYFHQLPLHFLLANLLLLPLLGLVLGWGFGVLLAAAAGHLPGWLATPYGYLLENMNAVAGWLGRQDGFVLTSIPWGWAELCLGFGALLALAGYIGNRSRLWLGGALACLLALQGYTLWQGHRQAGRSEWVVPHRVAAGGFWLREGPRLTLYTTDADAFARLAEAYQTGERIEKVSTGALQNSYTLGGRHLLVVDSAGIFNLPQSNPDLVLLTGSPRIHLGRLIETCKPQSIVADGNNYSSYTARWEQTCRHYGVPFHATAKSGAFRMALTQAN